MFCGVTLILCEGTSIEINKYKNCTTSIRNLNYLLIVSSALCFQERCESIPIQSIHQMGKILPPSTCLFPRLWFTSLVWLFNAACALDICILFCVCSGMPVSKWMEDWSFRPWYPLVDVQLRGSTSLQVFVKQSQFDLAGGTDCNATNSWWIPISYIKKVYEGGWPDL